MATTSRTTTDHETIIQWAEDRDGHPATVKRTAKDDDPGLLRIDFPGYSGEESLEEISWDAFFEKFEEKNLAFLYQDKTKDGSQSRFFKLVSREGDGGKSSGAKRATKGTAKSSSSQRAAKKSAAKSRAKKSASR